jgi:hypothetical protein
MDNKISLIGCEFMKRLKVYVALAILLTYNLLPIYAQTPEGIYQEKLAKINDDAKGHYELGVWCKQNKLSNEAQTQFEKVIKLDPNHEKARKELGYFKYKDEWIAEEDKEERIAKEKGLVRYGDKWIAKQEMASLREKERRSFNWDFESKIQTKHYLIYASTTEETNNIGKTVECLYDTFTKFFGKYSKLPAKPPIFRIKIFKDHDEFVQKTGGRASERSAAFYDRKNKVCNIYNDSRLYNNLLHEATHQLCCELLVTIFPKWLHEGLACYFSIHKIRDNKIMLGEIEESAYPVSQFGQGLKDLNQLLSFQLTSQWESAKNVHPQYGAACSFCYFLFHYKNGCYKDAFSKYIMEYARSGKDNPKGFETLVGKIDDLQKEWQEYLKSLK